MCGIAGFVSTAGAWRHDAARQAVEAMTATLEHRGPDDGGIWLDAEAGAALGHRRLSIIDLTPEGHQPMASACGRYVITYNGEIYNYLECQRELAAKGHRFRGRSDTEVVLAAFSEWGIVQALERFNGMFAIGVWDRRERVLTLARDRMGQKPLYFGWVDGALLFGSELRALRAFPRFRPKIDRNALTLLLRRGCIPAPHSIFAGVFKLLPGHYLEIRADARADLPPQIPYWSLREVLESGARESFPGHRSEALEELGVLLRDAVHGCMLSDVPLGAFLSGGIDSSLIVALMQAQTDRPVRTFSIGFREPDFDEAPMAAGVAAHLGTDHTELYVTQHDALDLIPRLPEIWDEPFADSSQIPTRLLAALTRQHVTVALSGDGGDELFGGYAKYRYFEKLARLRRLPAPVRRGLGAAISAASRLAPATRAGVTARRLAGVLSGPLSEQDLYVHAASIWKNPGALVIGATEPRSALTALDEWPDLAEPVRRAMALDALSYLPDDVLVKVDRAAMSAGLETRIPLLDHRVVELAARLPLTWTYRNGRGKLLLRELLARHVPRRMIERPKAGFSVPIGDWLRGPLRGWAEAHLHERCLRDDQYFVPEPISQKWQQHLAGRADWSGYLWPVLMFQAWKSAFRLVCNQRAANPLPPGAVRNS